MWAEGGGRIWAGWETVYQEGRGKDEAVMAAARFPFLHDSSYFYIVIHILVILNQFLTGTEKKNLGGVTELGLSMTVYT